MKTRCLMVAALLSLPAGAWAQNYVVQMQSAAFVPISGGTTISAWTPTDSFLDPGDEGTFSLPLGFNFTWYGQTFTTVNVNTNGFIAFGAGCTQNCFPSAVTGVPNPLNTVHNFVAPWWDDFDLTLQGSVVYTTSATQAEIEFRSARHWLNSGTVTFKITITAAGAIQVHYGTASGSGLGAVNGFENAAGTAGATLFACPAAPFPPPAVDCDVPQFPTNTLYTISVPVQPDLVVDQVNLGSVQRVGADMQIAVTPTFRNFGQQGTGASTFTWKAYLSTDRIYQAGTDTLFLTSTAPLTCAGLSTVSDTATGTVSPAPPPGNYYVIVEADQANTVAEGSFGEANNFGATTNYFSQGVDLVATGITGPAMTGPGNMIMVHLNYFNQGIDPVPGTGAMGYRIYLSSNTTWDASDFALYPPASQPEATKVITGGQTVSEDITFPVPQNVQGGAFYYILKLDPSGLVPEGSETNNTFTSTGQVTVRQADLVLRSVDLIDPGTGVSMRRGLIGRPAVLRVQVANEGGADARNFKIGVVISSDASLSLLQDTIAIEFDVAQVLQGAVVTIDVPFTLPLNDRTGHPFATGQYFFYGLVDSRSDVTELSETNNNGAVGPPGVPAPIILQAPAPDLTVLRFDAPSAVGVGEIAPVLRSFKNIGTAGSMEVRYRYYVSANAAVTTDDTPLKIVVNGAMTDFGTITLMEGDSSMATEFVQLPATIPPGTYYLGAVIDSDRQQVEIDELNNGLGSMPVQVAASNLRICSTGLPDGVVGRPYAFQLTACGELPGMATTWAIDTAQGALPAGLTLSSSGLLGGMPSAEAVTGITVTATNAGRMAVARLVIRVLPTTTQVEITTPSLPSVVNSMMIMYETWLGAAGGVKPYTWRIVPMAGEMDPATAIGVRLTADGKLAGVPRSGVMEKAYPVTIEVRDTLGTTSQRRFNLRVVAPGSIVFQNLYLPDGLVGSTYLTDISVKNFDMSPLATPLEYRLVAGGLPDGLKMTKEGNVLLLDGSPTVAGTFAFTIEVEDAKGRNDAADFLVRIYPSQLKVGVNGMLEQYRPGDTVDFNFVVAGSTGVTYSLFSGTLPPTSTLNPDGRVTGMIDTDKTDGTYNFVIEARDPKGATGLAAFSALVKRDPARGGGCSSTGGAMGLWAALLAVPALLRRRRVAALVAVLVMALPLAASAQDYQVIGPAAGSYSALPQPTTVSAGTTVPIPFPFKFFGQSITSIVFTEYGYLTTSTIRSGSNQAVPHNASGFPPNFIAPWWDAWCTTCGATLRYQVFTQPSRYIVFEWTNMKINSTQTSGTSFEALLFEGSDEIRFAYGPAAPSVATSGSVGVQKDLGVGVSALGCSPSCASYSPSTTISFQRPPDLLISSLSMDQVGYVGVRYNATAQVANQGGRAATNTLVRYWLSTDAMLDPMVDALIGETASTTFPPSSTTTINARTDAKIPSMFPGGMVVAPGPYYVLSKVDPDNTAPPESNENNNLGAPQAITIGSPLPDLITEAVTGPMTAMPGGTVALGRTIRNAGNATSGTFKYTWFISENSVVSISDTVLGTPQQVSDLMPMATSTAMDMVMLPSSLPAGQYWIGACVNYDPQATPQFGVTEISQVNNCNQATQSIVVSTGQLTIITPAALPAAVQHSPYGLRLIAAGGNGSYGWAPASGTTLPPGLTFNSSGDLQGTPSVAGTFSFGVTVTSGSAMQMQTFMLTVNPGNIPLSIVDQDLPAAEFGRAYGADLVAVGGKPPYVWKLKADSRLPSGLAVSDEGGIEGRANEAGDFSFGVEVTDAMMTKMQKDLRIRVVMPSSMHIATSRLRTAFLKQDYTQQLVAVGGKPPYTWTILNFQALPQNPTEKPGDAGNDFPMGFGIFIDDGNLDYLRGEPKKAGLYAVTLRAVDNASAEDFTTLLLNVSYTEPIAIVTTALPDAFQGKDYGVKLSHNRGRESTGVEFSLPCVQQAVSATRFECAPVEANQKLPLGLSLKSDGTISGATTETGDQDKVFTFLVKVVDDAGRQDVRSLSIRVRPNTAATQGGGCSSAAALAPLMFAALLLVLARRKRASL